MTEEVRITMTNTGPLHSRPSEEAKCLQKPSPTDKVGEASEATGKEKWSMGYKEERWGKEKLFTRKKYFIRKVVEV